MGFNITLEGEDRKIKERVDDPYDVINRVRPTYDDPRFKLIRYIDPYGDTVFNWLQMDDFLADWRLFSATAIDERAQLLLKQVEELAQKIRPHLYLRFIGD
jgi:hypothetical protein